jgi:ribonuclease VapC
VSDAFVLDASALLCLLNGETGATRVAGALGRSVISAVNLSEVVAKLTDSGGSAVEIAAAIESLQLEVVPFDELQAMRAGLLRQRTRRAGLSFGDRACLALGENRGAIVLTCDGAWSTLDLGVTIEQLR